ncbi:lactose-binding lectin l-2-like [Cheilinus undulatus]|uniref:lactose-binding lectin l-2-like n=1 Tax=Cheilinus undulatus TaxID=241271 RepID=UPI001BD5DD05|nr:lactose-binding lectin l-2-like [Cheilinus undulatus]
MLLLLFLFGLALAAPPPSDEPDLLVQRGGCPEFWYSFNGRCYKYISTPMAWADAEIHCVSEKANLVSIHSQGEQNFIKSLVRNFDPSERTTWIGLSDVHKEGNWLWSDGSAVDFDFWHTGQPDNYQDTEDCADMNWGPQLKWNDVPCSAMIPFVCVARTMCNCG